MEFSLNETQALISASALDWLGAHYDFRSRENSVHQDGGSAPVWAAWAELGWLALPLKEQHGGIAGTALETGVLMHALGRYLTVEPYHGCVLQAARLLSLAGTADQQDRWLPQVAAGRQRLAFAHYEEDDTSPWPTRRCSVRRHGSGWLLSGSKHGVEGAAGAACWLVSAFDADAQCTRVMLVTPDNSNIALNSYDTTDGARAADIHFEEVMLPDDAVLGGAKRDITRLLRQVLAEGLVSRCWQANGAMQMALDQTVQYTKNRRQFGQALADFQVVQHRLAEMAVQCTEALAACELAAMQLTNASGNPLEAAAMAMNKVGRAARYVSQEAVQLHGAMGVCEELPIAAAFRMLMTFMQRDGVSAEHALQLGQALLASGAHEHSQTLGVAA